MKIIIEGKQGEGKTRVAQAIAALINYGGKTFILRDGFDSNMTNLVYSKDKPDVEIITRQTK